MSCENSVRMVTICKNDVTEQLQNDMKKGDNHKHFSLRLFASNCRQSQN